MRAAQSKKETSAISTSAKMYEALVETQLVIAKCMDILNKIPGGVEYDGLIDDVADELGDLRDSYVKPALAAPLRNCDLHRTKKEQDEAYKKYREHVIMSNSNPFIAQDEMMSKEEWLCAEAKAEEK